MKILRDFSSLFKNVIGYFYLNIVIYGVFCFQSSFTICQIAKIS